MWCGRISELLAADSRLGPTEVFRSLCAEGYDGSYETIKRYVRKLRGGGTQLPALSPAVERKCLSRMLYKNSGSDAEISASDFACIVELHPEIQAVFDTVRAFRAVLESGDPTLLDQWVADTENHVCPTLRSAAKGIRQDIEASRNAVRLSYSNGVAEGNNTKIKQAVRVGYGRCKFDTLRKRVLLQDARRHSSEPIKFIT